MAKLTIVANFYVKAEKLSLVRAELDKLVAATREEQGCINYDLHQNNANPLHFLFYENWESRELWQAHMNSQHLQQYREAVKGAIDSITMAEMSLLE